MRAKIDIGERGKRQVRNPCTTPCAIERGMRVIGGKWTGSILWHLRDGPVRFNDLARMISGASKKMITDRLRRLVAQGLVSREVQSSTPIMVHYALTPLGATALEFLDQIRDWSERLPADVS